MGLIELLFLRKLLGELRWDSVDKDIMIYSFTGLVRKSTGRMHVRSKPDVHRLLWITRMYESSIRDSLSPMYSHTTQEYVPYEGADDNGYLVKILGAEKYTALTELEYEKPEEKAPAVHPDIDKDTTEEKKAELKAEQSELIEAWWARLGWIEGTGHNIQAALDKNNTSSSNIT